MRPTWSNAAATGLPSLAALALLAGSAWAQADASREQRIALARQEQEVVWYTAMNTSDAEPLRKAFEKRYPFLELTILRQPGEKVRTRILTEARAGRNFWDVVSFNHLDMDALDQEGLLASYSSPETRTGFPAGAVDPRGRWAAIYVRQYVIGYNTRAVPAADAPKTWQDLLQPRWRGKFAMDENEIEWYGAVLDYLGREKGVAFMRALARQQPQFRRGHTLLSKLLVAGDFPLALVHAAEMEEARKNGAPVDWAR
jgi:iron(III) transport system substrate-binding protein